MMTGGISGSYNPYAYPSASGTVRQTQSGSGRAASARSGSGSDYVPAVNSGYRAAASAQPSGSGSATILSNADGKVSIRTGQAQETDDPHKVKGGYKSSPADCQTCKERKYQDGSNESDVSFKAPGHIAPEASAATVMAHEQQHVSNAYQKAAEKDGQVVSCSVSLHTAICPECGTVYVSGGTTSTAISYPDETNPYRQDKKGQDAIRLKGANFNGAA